MIFSKQPHHANFVFASRYEAGTFRFEGKRRHTVDITEYEGGICRLHVRDAEQWPDDYNLVELDMPAQIKPTGRFRLDPDGSLVVMGDHGKPVLCSQPGGFFGVMGPMSMFCFVPPASAQYYGLGEKSLGRFELSNLRSRFWNTDALGDFPSQVWWNSPTDPYYVSIPYVIVRVGDEYVGLLLHNLTAPFVDTGSDASFMKNMDESRRLVLGAEDGEPHLIIIHGRSLAELTAKFQKMVGVTPVPPTWSLGYHQCRWGYKGERDIVELDAKMTEHEIPNDGIWLDIDYMEGFRVFTYAKEHFPKGVPKAIDKGARNRRRIVPIIDPGVKMDPGYAVYDDGAAQNVFCLNPEGQPFIGVVWPGLTAFPDFSLPRARDWWSDYAKSFREQGFAGAWLDMNDPSTGCIDPRAMLFNNGKWSHIAFRNQYALGMQMATRQGFAAAQPNERVFLLTRSGCTGTGRYAAVWTGDNVSDRFYLRGCIATALNLSLSGIPFNGNDIGGFFGDTNEELMRDWAKTCFLFPFFRIHSIADFRPQEPWSFRKPTQKAVVHYIRLRYKLLPYLYNTFLEQNRDGHPMLRPLIYFFNEDTATDDQFMVGGSILQAPLVDEARTRRVVLPGAGQWFDLNDGRWKRGRQTANDSLLGTPIYIRENSIIPCLPGERTTNEKPLNDVEFHVFVRKGTAEVVYRYDDGETLGYERGEQSAVRIRATLRGDKLSLETEMLESGYGSLSAQFVVYGEISRLELNGQPLRKSKSAVKWTEAKLPVVRSQAVTLQ